MSNSINKILFNSFYLLFSLYALNGQTFYYSWNLNDTTLIDIELKIHYSADSSMAFISKKELTGTSDGEFIDPRNSSVYLIKNYDLKNESSLNLPLVSHKYIFIPFDPENFIVKNLNAVYLMKDTLKILTSFPDSLTLNQVLDSNQFDEVFGCACYGSPEAPGGCVSTLETHISGGKISRCISNEACEYYCIGHYIYRPSGLIRDNGIILQIKDRYDKSEYR